MQKKYSGTIAVYILVYFFLQGCSAPIKISPRPIKGIKITQIRPFFKSDWSILRYDTNWIYRYTLDNKVLLDFPGFFVNMIDKTEDTSALGHIWFVYRKGDTSGIQFEYLPAAKEKSVVVDSVLAFLPKADVSSYLSGNNNVELVKKMEDPNIGLLTEEYRLTEKKDTTNSAILFLRFSNRLKVPDFSFSPQYDSLKQMKLVKLRMTTFPRHDAIYQKTAPTFFLSFEMEEILPADEKKLMYYFDKLETQKTTN